MTYNRATGHVVLFGGQSADPGDRTPQSLWEWDGKHWRCLVPTGPPGRDAAFLAFDAARNRLVLFGGRVSAADGPARFLLDTWEWDGRYWTLVDTAGPAPRIHGNAAYDPIRRRVVIHGGGGAVGILTDTWEWTGVQWRAVPLRGPVEAIAETLIPTSHGLEVLLAIRDSTPECVPRRRAVLFVVRGDSLVQSGAPGPCFSPMAPSAATANGFLLYAGWNALDPATPVESWTWNGRTWHQADQAPPRRRNSGAAYDEKRNRVVLFGGDDGNSVLGDTWEWDGIRWIRVDAGAAPVR